MINPAAIPQIKGDMGVLGQHATSVSGVGTAFSGTGAKVHSTWQGLAAVYSAPEASQLFAATGPVQSVSASVGEDVAAVGGVLNAYATEVAPIKARLEALRTQASAFVEDVTGDEDWREDQGKVDRHNQLLSDVNGAVADFMDAQRRCANAILARYSDKRYTAENGDGTITDTEFGYTKDVFDAALAQDEALPWGKPEEHDRGFFGDVGAFFVGFGHGAVGFVQGLGALIGYSDGKWSWGNAGTAWKGLGIFALSTSPVLTMINETTDLPGLPKGTLGSTLLGAGKALIAYDTWKEDKSKAAGEVTFNIVSAIVGTKGAGAGLRGAGAAAEASRFATVAKLGAGAVKAGEFITALPKVSDVVLGTVKRFPGFKLPHIDLPHVDVPTTHVDAPHIEAPGGRAPDGPSVGDAVGDRHPLPPAATITPDGVVDGRALHQPAPHAPEPSIVHDGVIGGRPHVDTPTPHGADAPGHRSEPLPAGATISDKGVVPGHHGGTPHADAGSGVHIDRDGVIRAGSPADAPVPHGAEAPGGTPAHGANTPAPHDAGAPAPHEAGTPATHDAGTPAPHGAETPATPGRPGADAPVRNAEPLPPGATITDRGVVPGHQGTGPLHDAGTGVHIDRDGVIRPGPHPDAPPVHAPREPALVGAGEHPLVRNGVIGGHGGGHLDDVAGGATHAPKPDPLIHDGVIGGGRGIDHAPPPLHGEPGRPGGVHPPEPPRGGRLPEDPAVHPHDPGGGGHDPAGHPPHDPTPHDPGTHDPGTHDPGTHDPGTHDPGTHDPGTHDPGTHDTGGHDGAGHDGASGHHPAPDTPEGRRIAAEHAAETPAIDHLFQEKTPRIHPDALDGREIEVQELGTLDPKLLGKDANGLITSIGGRPVDDVLREIGHQRAEAFYRARGLDQTHFSRNRAGEVNSVALDRRTGDIIEGWNGKADQVIPDNRVHDLLQRRLDALREAGPYDEYDFNGNKTGNKIPFPHPDEPLGHAEVKAVNELLHRRGPGVDQSVFGEFQVDNFKPFKGAGAAPAVECCANCARMLAGTPATPGRFTGFPPQFFPREPR
jgi:hypothetical protein